MDKELKNLLEDMEDNTQDYVGTNGCLYQDLERDELNLILDCISNLQNQVKKQKEVIDKGAEYIEKHIKYECDDAYNGMQFYSYHLYDFNKQELLDILNEVSE